ncbi:Pentatricopeptide repeat-containing protein [Platanthera guangdongensis]|uniref:Pentatricopeptide repeat-containing protein n=1 Tax=Platanthera guangdongensis TaxID=2320717 RepID=A0ABR2M579_9ASPA
MTGENKSPQTKPKSPRITTPDSDAGLFCSPTRADIEFEQVRRSQDCWDRNHKWSVSRALRTELLNATFLGLYNACSTSLLPCKIRYASANETEKAIKTFHALEKFNVEVDSAAFYALLRALCKNKNTQEAEELLLTKRGFFPLETAGFNIVLDGWCNIFPDETEAKRVLEGYGKYCIAPDATSYTHMICFFAKLRNLFDSLRLYNEMKRRGWVPSLKVHNCIIYVLTSEGCIKEAFNLLNKIMALGLQPDLKTYNSMILPLCEAHRLDEAREVMKMMSSGSVRPSVETYHALIKIVNSEAVFELIDRMREHGCRPVANTYLLMF